MTANMLNIVKQLRSPIIEIIMPMNNRYYCDRLVNNLNLNCSGMLRSGTMLSLFSITHWFDDQKSQWSWIRIFPVHKMIFQITNCSLITQKLFKHNLMITYIRSKTTNNKNKNTYVKCDFTLNVSVHHSKTHSDLMPCTLH